MISASNICDLIKLVRTCEALNWGTDGDLTDVGVLWGAPITVHTFNGSGVPRYAVIPLDGETLVCIAGTTQPLQWAQQLLLSSLVPSPDTPGSVNTFYALAGHRIVFGLGPLTGTITFTGHSMGGALALYCHSHFRQTNPLSQAIVFGQPRAGNARRALFLGARRPRADDPPCPARRLSARRAGVDARRHRTAAGCGRELATRSRHALHV
jgi:hypothetical protein